MGLNLSNCRVFFDFDNTITPFDVLDDIIKRFSINDRWKALEEAWVEGKIGSKECLQGQLRSIRVTKRDLVEYLSKIKIDRHFKRLFTMLKKEGTDLVIVSDGFSFIIESILQNNGVRGVKVYSNRLRFYKDKLIPVFPYENQQCFLCANCKKMHLQNNGSDNKIRVYVGDGLSDICAAQNADLIFAKEGLLKYFKNKKKHCVAFQNLREVYNYFTEAIHGRKAEDK